jgi:competence protein ComEC
VTIATVRCGVIGSALLLAGPLRGQTLLLRQLDVGQGDAALIVTPEGKRILIDAGPDAHSVANVLTGANDTLDLAISSHNHADHIGGMPDVFASEVVRAYVDNGLPTTTAIYRRTLKAVESESTRYLQATARTITVGSVVLRVLAPPKVDDTQNNNSVGVLIEFGQFRALYTGDSERPELAEWLRQRQISSVTLVKAAHHGSTNGVTPAWVRKTSPRLVIISVGAGNRYHHPSAAVERLWKSAGARVYRTDHDGEVDVRATRDGNFTVTTHASAETTRSR